MAKQQFQTVPGTHDVLPDHGAAMSRVAVAFARAAGAAGYGPLTTPLVEPAGSYERAFGARAASETATFIGLEAAGGAVVVRPELPVAAARAFVQHGLSEDGVAVRLMQTAPVARYHDDAVWQRQEFGAQVFGDASPAADVQVIALAERALRRLQLGAVSLRVNSTGDASCRPKYQAALVEYLGENEKQLSETDRLLAKTAPMSVLASTDPATQVILGDAPQTLNHLCEGCQAHLAGVLEYLDDLGVAYDLDPQLVPRCDYYGRTVFELAVAGADGEPVVVGGGGRFDRLVELLGGEPTPAVGVVMGLDDVTRLVAASVSPVPERRVYVASLGEPARLAAFRLIEHLLDAGVPATGAVDRDGIGAQLARAEKLGVPSAVIIGQKEVQDGTVLLRDMATGAQETIKLEAIVGELVVRFKVTE